MVLRGQFIRQGTNKKHQEMKSTKTWSNGKIIRGLKKIDSLNYTLHYSSPAAWEGIRAYKQADGSTKIFRLKEHVQRLFDSAKIEGFEIPFTLNEVIQGCKDVVEANGGGDLYLRPIAYAATDAESAKPQNLKISLDIYCFPIPALHSGKAGIKVKISDIKRGYPQFDMQAKTPRNYYVLERARPEMKSSKVDDLLVKDNQGYIVEALVANLFMVKNGIIITPPNKGSILPGITRRTVIDILGNKPNMFSRYQKAPIVVEKDITRSDLYLADCVFLCGTYAEIVKVKEVDGRNVDVDDSYFKIVKAEYSKLVRGNDV